MPNATGYLISGVSTYSRDGPDHFGTLGRVNIFKGVQTSVSVMPGDLRAVVWSLNARHMGVQQWWEPTMRAA